MALLTIPRNSMHRSHPHLSLMLLLLLLPLLTQGYVEEERLALLELKRGFVDHFNDLESWNSSSSQEDCCGWKGITCRRDGGEAHVISLNLSDARLNGKKISPSLLSLKHLQVLDLSYNRFFQGTPIPPFIGNFSNLISLNLAGDSFGGAIPPQLGMLRNLEHLDLSGNYFQGNPIPPFIGNFSNLTTLNLIDAGFGGHIPPQLGMLRNLEQLDLSYNNFQQGTPIPPFIGNFSNLKILDLSYAGFGGAIPPQLGMLRNLEQLYLSGNNFQQDTPIPPFIGNFSNLKILDLSGFIGAIPPQLGMLRNLEQLDLSRNDFQQGTPIPPFIGNFSNLKILYLYNAGFGGAIPPQLGMLRNLEQLDLSYNNLTSLNLVGAGFGGAIPPRLGMLRNLEELDLSKNDFQGAPIPPFIGNFSNLTSLNLVGAGFGGAIPPRLGMLRKLQDLSISNSLDSGGEKTSSSYPQLYVEDFRWISNLSLLETLQFSNVDMGRASDWESSLSRLPLLQTLILHSCNLTSSLHGGTLPSQSSTTTNGFASLQKLDLSHNKQLGKSFFPTWFFSLNSLWDLTLEDCSLDGVLTEHHFGSNLTSLLTNLDMSNNPHLHIRINPHWVPPFNLSYLYLSSCQVGPRFPLWLRTQENLQELRLSNAGLQDSLPTWIWSFSPSLDYVDLSQNQLFGRNLDLSSHGFFTTLDLSSNNFSGHLPALARSSSVGYLNLSYNSFSGCLSRLICHDRRTCSSLLILDLDNNHLSGNMSDCWDGCTSLKLVRISNNYLTGPFSNSLGQLGDLLSLHLRNNSLSGTLLFLEKHNWTNLITLDLGVNKFNGNLKGPYWKKLPKLRFLILDSNEIYGIIPREICNLENLQILNLASNNLSETIPTCFTNFRGMMMKPEASSIGLYFGNENLQLFTRGRLDDYSEILGLVTLLDISNNHFSGEIPTELMNLVWLYSLNLSRNQLTGPIPMNIGGLRWLSSLDLSINRLSGKIPQAISQLTSLDHLNVSHNKLSGKIPFGAQLQTFNSSSYIGNTLCGEPLPEKCDNASSPTERDTEEYKGSGDDSRLPFYVAVPIGFGAGTSAIFITLLFRRSWRIAYFLFIESILNKLF